MVALIDKSMVLFPFVMHVGCREALLPVLEHVGVGRADLGWDG